jgi:hypothetical protein
MACEREVVDVDALLPKAGWVAGSQKQTYPYGSHTSARFGLAQKVGCNDATSVQDASKTWIKPVSQGRLRANGLLDKFFLQKSYFICVLDAPCS